MKRKDRREKVGVPECPYCHQPLVRVFKENGVIICNYCGVRLDRPVSSDPRDGRFVKCPYCGYEGEELINPTYNTKCPRCGKHILQIEVNKRTEWLHGNYRR